MLKSNSLKTRLTLLNTLLLVLILGAGGFFLYSSQQGLLYDRFDSDLLDIARDLSCDQHLAAQAPATPEAICASLNRTSLSNGERFVVALYATDGNLLCSNESQLLKLPQLSAANLVNNRERRISFDSLALEDGRQFRQLIYPIVQNDEVNYQLQLLKPLNQLTERLQMLALLLTFSGLSATICFALCHWLLLSLFTAPLAKLARRMDKTDEENLDKGFNASPLFGQELQQLAASYNSLIERLKLSLHKAHQFSADVTHELRTPLTILRGETEIALRGEKSSEEMKQVLTSNLEEIGRMGRLIEDLLMLSKSELGEIPLQMEAIDLGSLLDELHFQAKIIAEDKQIQVDLKRSKQQVSLYADGLRLRQVFLNLLTNAVKYTPEGGKVSIDWSLQGNTAEINIADTGIGIGSKHLDHIFDRFYRIEKTRNRNDGGSGLGLAIVKWIVDAHHGRISVTSTPGKGSCFTVTLPLTHLQTSAQDLKNF